MAAIRTLGHGTLDQPAFVDLVRGAGIAEVVDVRRYPGSRRHPWFARDAMASWLPDAGIAYRWVEDLGGRRRPDPASPNTALRNDQFRAYADHMATDVFAAAVGDLVTLAGEHAVAVMCSESVWWRCHRRLVADHLELVEDVAVEHVFHDGRLVRHPVLEHARREGDHVVYDGGQAAML